MIFYVTSVCPGTGVPMCSFEAAKEIFCSQMSETRMIKSFDEYV